MSNDEIIQRQEDRLIRRQRSYHNAYVGAIFLCIIFFIVFVGFSFVEPDTRNHEVHKFSCAMAWFWLAVAVYTNAKLDHIRTIQRYRELIIP